MTNLYITCQANMLQGAATHHGSEVGAFFWTEGAHPKPKACSVRQGHEPCAEESSGLTLIGHRQEATLVQTSERGMAPQESVMRDLKPRRSWDGTTAVAGPATQSCQQVTLSVPRHRPPSTGMDQAHVKAREQHRLCPGSSGQAL